MNVSPSCNLCLLPLPDRRKRSRFNSGVCAEARGILRNLSNQGAELVEMVSRNSCAALCRKCLCNVKTLGNIQRKVSQLTEYLDELISVSVKTMRQEMHTLMTTTQSPPNVDREVHSPVPLDAGVHSPVPFDAGVHSPVPLGAEAHSPVPLDAGAHSPIPLDAGAHSPVPLDAGTHSPVPLDAGAHSPVPLDAGHSPVPTTQNRQSSSPSLQVC